MQVNACRNVTCGQFGRPPKPASGNDKASPARYSATGSPGAFAIKCLECGQLFRVKSNRAVADELRRISAPLAQPDSLKCKTDSCVNASGEQGFQRFGRTRSGSARFRCRVCGKTVSASTVPTLRQRRPEKNVEIMRLVVNKMPMRRILEVADISASTLYRKLEHISRQCVAFSASHEQRLPDMAFERLNLATDRQDYLVNWGAHVNRSSFMIRAIATSDARSGFVFGTHPNFDPDRSLMALELAARENGDHERDILDRQYPQYWLMEDYTTAALAKAATAQRRGARPTNQPQKPHIADPFEEDQGQTAPARGVQVRQEYAIFAHYFYLRRLLVKVNRLTFFLDTDPGLGAAVLSAFRDRVTQATAHVFLVRSAKKLTGDQRRQMVANLEVTFRRHCKRTGLSSRHEGGLSWLNERFTALPKNDGTSIWIPHPFPDAAEPGKEIAAITLRTDTDIDVLSRSALYAGLKSTDRFFMLIRRRISLLERPISTPSSARRAWHGYSPYNPIVVCELLDLFRTVFNYHLTGRDKRTPAMRLGLCDRQYSLEELLATPRTDAEPNRPKTRIA